MPFSCFLKTEKKHLKIQWLRLLYIVKLITLAYLYLKQKYFLYSFRYCFLSIKKNLLHILFPHTLYT